MQNPRCAHRIGDLSYTIAFHANHASKWRLKNATICA